MTTTPPRTTIPTRTAATPDVLALLAAIPTLGVHADETELRYQLHRNGHPAGATAESLLEALADLEDRGLVTVSLAANLTAAGRQAVADAHLAPDPGTVYPPFPAPQGGDRA